MSTHKPAAEALIWIDTETTGLNTTRDNLLEIAIGITDLEGELLDSFERVMMPTTHSAVRDLMDWYAISDDPGHQLVYRMHKASGLWDEVLASTNSYESVDEQLMTFLTYTEVPLDDLGRAPMCGNTVNFDQRMCDNRLPQFRSQFGHRTIDMSSTKELVRRRHPDIAKAWDQICDAKGDKPHRAMEDILWSIEEYKFYISTGMIA